MGMAAMSPSQQKLLEQFEERPRLVGGRKVAEAADPVIRREMEDCVLAVAKTSDETLNHLLGAVSGELRCSFAREAITTVLIKATSE
jgi:hypothetical protein